MHIAIPIHSFEPGGVERVALRLAQRWQANGQQVTVVLGRDEGLTRSQSPDLDYRTLPQPLPTARWETIWMIWSLYRFLLTQRVDVVFCPGNTYTIVCVMMRLLLGERCPPILAKISNALDRPDLPQGTRPFLRFWAHVQGFFLDHFIALAGPMLPQIVDQLGVSNDKASIIANPALSAADLSKLGRGRTPRNERSCQFLTVGRLVPQKNHALLIEAFSLHAWPDDRLVIAGEGPERPALEYMIRRRGLQDRVHLVGHCDDIARLLEQSDVFVLSSDYEGLPTVVVEAMASGLPITATDCCASMEWLLQYGRFGLVAPAGNADALGAAMNATRHLTAPRREMAEFASQFTLERAAESYVSEMEALVQSRSDDHYKKLCGQMRVWTEHSV